MQLNKATSCHSPQRLHRRTAAAALPAAAAAIMAPLAAVPMAWPP